MIADISSNPKALDALEDVSRSGAKGGPSRIVTPTTVVGTEVIRGGELDTITKAVNKGRKAK